MHKTRRIVRTYENKIRSHAEIPGNPLIHSRRKKTLSACHALQSALIAPRPRPQCPDGLPVWNSLVICRKVLERRDMFENRRKNDNYNYTYVGYTSTFTFPTGFDYDYEVLIFCMIVVLDCPILHLAYTVAIQTNGASCTTESWPILGPWNASTASQKLARRL